MILVTGGSGVIGSRVVQGLLDTQQQVRILTRGGTDWIDNPLPQFRRSGVEIITGDVRDPNKVTAALSDCRAIIHLAAVMRGDDRELESVNVEGLLNIVSLAAAQGIQRFIYASCLGATQFSTSKYFQTKWQGETMVRSSTFYWTIFRPSLLFGPGSHLMRALDYSVSKAPFIPVIGSGLNQIQPISPDDVAACIIQSLYNRDTVQKTYDLLGPNSYSLTELMEMTARGTSANPKPTIKVPLKIGFLVTRLLSMIDSRAPISADLMRVITTELIGDSALMNSTFQVPMTSFEAQFKRLAKQR